VIVIAKRVNFASTAVGATRVAAAATNLMRYE
jgi:hypothetical protein